MQYTSAFPTIAYPSKQVNLNTEPMVFLYGLIGFPYGTGGSISHPVKRKHISDSLFHIK